MATKCRICKSPCVKKWDMKVRDRFKGPLHQCKKCDSLQFGGLDWLKDAYYGDYSIRFDEGRMLRNMVVYKLVRRLTKSFFNEKDITLLDYGSGEGVLCDLLKRSRTNYIVGNYDPQVKRFSELPRGKFDIVMCIEVLEHLEDVYKFYKDIKRALDEDSIFVCSTDLYQPGKHDKMWPYLSTEIGQHITFWTKKSIQYLKRIIRAEHCAILKCENRVKMDFILFSNRLPLRVPGDYELDLL